MLTVEEYRSGFLSYLENFKSPTNPKNLYEPVSYILGLKGKRIRPILTLLTCDIFNDNPCILFSVAVKSSFLFR